MRKIMLMLAALLLLASPALAAPFLTWDAVTTGSDDLPLGAGLEVASYRVYSCGTAMTGCTGPSRTLAATVTVPATQFDLAARSVPQVYVVTAVNKAGESGDSAAFKVVPPDIPKNLRLP